MSERCVKRISQYGGVKPKPFRHTTQNNARGIQIARVTGFFQKYPKKYYLLVAPPPRKAYGKN